MKNDSLSRDDYIIIETDTDINKADILAECGPNLFKRHNKNSNENQPDRARTKYAVPHNSPKSEEDIRQDSIEIFITKSMELRNEKNKHNQNNSLISKQSLGISLQSTIQSNPDQRVITQSGYSNISKSGNHIITNAHISDDGYDSDATVISQSDIHLLDTKMHLSFKISKNNKEDKNNQNNYFDYAAIMHFSTLDLVERHYSCVVIEDNDNYYMLYTNPQLSCIDTLPLSSTNLMRDNKQLFDMVEDHLPIFIAYYGTKINAGRLATIFPFIYSAIYKANEGADSKSKWEL